MAILFKLILRSFLVPYMGYGGNKGHEAKLEKVLKIFADGGYLGKLIDKVKTTFNIDIEIVKRNEQHKFKVLPKRWIVERIFSWIDTNRRISKNYGRPNQTSIAMVHLSAIRIMFKRF